MSGPQWSGSLPLAEHAAQRHDLSLAWAQATGWRRFCRVDALGGGADSVRVIARLRAGGQVAELRPIANIDPQYDQPVPQTGGYISRFFTATVAQSRLDAFAARVEAFELCVPRVGPQESRDDAIDIGSQSKALEAGTTARFVQPAGDVPAVVGVIDDGCAFLRDEFSTGGQRGDRTRIVALWDQGQRWTPPMPPQDPWWRTLPPFGYGRHLFNGEIDGLRALLPAQSDRSIYASLGYPRLPPTPVPPSTHGTAVLSLAAAGTDPTGQLAAPSNAAIVFVQLPAAVSRDSSGGGLAAHLLDGVRYILAMAAALRQDGAAAIPVVVNVSYGYCAGPHDGQSLIEQALDELASHHPSLAIVIAAGNAGNGGLGAKARIQGQHAFDWKIAAGDSTESFVRLWLDEVTPGKPTQVSLRAPESSYGAGVTPDSGPVGPDELRQLTDADGNVVAMVALRSRGRRQLEALIALAPSAGPGPTVAPGPWRISVTAEGALCRAYIQRDDDLRPPRSDRQSRFAPGTPAADSLSAIATGAMTIVVGAHRPTPAGGMAAVLETSGRGPTAGARVGPDVTAMGESASSGPVPCLPFKMDAAPPGFGGTSAATAIVTRLVAGHLAATNAASSAATTRAWLQQLAQANAARDGVYLDPGATGAGPLP